MTDQSSGPPYLARRSINDSSNHPMVFILGAGFSNCAGLPLQKDSSPLLLSPIHSSELDTAITRILKTFLKEVFGWCEGSMLPGPEDIFTSLDLAVGGKHKHSLGIQYPPKKLRAIRRIAIHRIFAVLNYRFYNSPDIVTLLREAWGQSSSRPAFVVLNWDIGGQD